jgi:hypothetical protein
METYPLACNGLLSNRARGNVYNLVHRSNEACSRQNAKDAAMLRLATLPPSNHTLKQTPPPQAHPPPLPPFACTSNKGPSEMRQALIRKIHGPTSNNKTPANP